MNGRHRTIPHSIPIRGAVVVALGAPALASAATLGHLVHLPGADACISESGTGGSCADGVALTEARAVVVMRSAKDAYAASSTSDAVSAFRRE